MAVVDLDLGQLRALDATVRAGTLEAAEAPGGGAVFTMHLPVEGAAMPTGAAAYAV